MPRLALLPLVLLLFGIGEAARVVIVALSCLFPLLINATTGVRQIASAHFEVARSFGAGRWHVFTQVVLPGSLPSVLAGARLSLISAFKTTLGIELITAEDGLGHLIWFAWEAFRPEELYATLLVIAGLGVVLSAGLARIVALAQPGRAAVAP